MSDAEHPRLQARAAEIADRLMARMDEEVAAFWDRLFEAPDLRDWQRPEPGGQLWEEARNNVTHVLSGLRNGFAIPATCPAEVSYTARVSVERGVPIEGAVQLYRTGTAVAWESWHDEVEALDLPAEERRALMRRGSRYLFEYGDRCAWWVWAAYMRERDRRLRGDEQRRIQVVRDLLDGGDPDVEVLGYDLELHHLGVIARGAEAEATLADLAGELRATLLAVAAHHDTWWGWLGRRGELDAAARRSLVQFRPPPATTVAVGGPAPGAEGFRRAHSEAQSAHRVALRRPAPVTLYDDVALEALAAEDDSRARAFVARELGPLAADDPRAHTLRATLRAYFGVAQNASSAAALLGVHERTVANRLRAVEEHLGRPVSARHAELDTALRLHELLVD